MTIFKPTPFGILGAMALIFSVYLPAALLLERDYIPVAQPQGALVAPLGAFQYMEGFSYRASALPMSAYEDNDSGNQHSPVVLYENLTPLGPPHSSHSDIQTIGHGRYSHWGDNPKSGWRQIRGMLFSTSDNSDPRTNGRHYWAVLPDTAAKLK